VVFATFYPEFARYDHQKTRLHSILAVPFDESIIEKSHVLLHCDHQMNPDMCTKRFSRPLSRASTLRELKGVNGIK
jgi:hypothetical protein